MNKFEPNEAVIEGFRRVAENSSAKIKQYLLDRIGLASHDIRAVVDDGLSDKLPFFLVDRVSSFGNFAYLNVFVRSAQNTRVCFLNASGTDPVVTAIHFFCEVPSTVPIDVTGAFTGHSIVKEISGKTVSLPRSYLIQDDKDADSDTLKMPVLSKGNAVVLNTGFFQFGLEMRVDPQVRERLFNESHYVPDDLWLNKAHIAFGRLMKESIVWYGVVLDNQELLPFRWSPEDRRFTSGFYSDGIVVSGN